MNSNPAKLLFCVLLFWVKLSYSQLQKSEVQYIRPSVTFLFLEENEVKKRDIAQAMINSANNNSSQLVTERFDFIPIGQISIPALRMGPEPQPPVISGEKDKAALELIELIRYKRDIKKYRQSKSALLKTQIPQVAKNIVQKLYNVDKNGNMNIDYLKQRGLFTASDADIILDKASQTTRLSTKMIAELLQKIMIIVYDVEDITKFDKEYYDRLDRISKAAYDTLVKKGYKLDPFKPVDRVSEGYEVKFAVHIYKIDPTWFSTFDSQFWLDESITDPALRRRKITEFKNATIPVSEINKLTRTFAATAPYGSNTSINTLFNKSFEEIQYLAFEAGKEKSSELAVKSTVFESYPISSKIGKKEDVFVGQRFSVYQMSQKDEGADIKKKLVGVVEAKYPISDNRGVATGKTNPTYFRQIYGKKVYPGNQLVVRKGTRTQFANVDLFQGGSRIGLALSYDVNLSVGRSLKEDREYFPNSKKRKPKGILWGMELGLVPNWFLLTATAAKEFYLLKTGNLFLYPKLGIGAALAGISEEATGTDGIAITPSLGLGYNITPSLVVMARFMKIPSVEKYVLDPRDPNNMLLEKSKSIIAGVGLKLRF